MMPLSGGPTPAVSRRLLRDEVYDQILAAIIDGTLEPGETLRDDELMAWLGVSRTPVREALNRLAEEAVVELAPRRHTRVAPLDFAGINEAMFVTGVLNEHAARQAVGNLSDAALDELDDQLKQAHAALEARDRVHLTRAITYFLMVFNHATANTVLVKTVESCFPQLTRYLTPRDELPDPTAIMRQFTLIRDAARARDAERVGDLIHALYAPTRANFLETFRTDPDQD